MLCDCGCTFMDKNNLQVLTKDFKDECTWLRALFNEVFSIESWKKFARNEKVVDNSTKGRRGV